MENILELYNHVLQIYLYKIQVEYLKRDKIKDTRKSMCLMVLGLV